MLLDWIATYFLSRKVAHHRSAVTKLEERGDQCIQADDLFPLIEVHITPAQQEGHSAIYGSQ